MVAISRIQMIYFPIKYNIYTYYCDCFGRDVASLKNVWIYGDLPTSYYTSNAAVRVQTDYDVLDRPITTHWADGAESFVSYEIGDDALGHKRLLQKRTDENGNEWQQYTSPQGWLTTSVAPDEATTTFRYDPLGQLLQSTDPDGLATTHTYDGFGRRTKRVHPDAGSTRWTYDAAGNRIASATQVQLDNNEETVYEYDYNQLTAVRYPRYPQYDITYEYDSETGRLYYVSDITGDEYFEYDAMGNVSMSDKYIAVPTENMTYNLVTRYRYDSFGRMRRITYPDGEEVDYNYWNGLLQSVANTEGETYIQSIVYDEYDAPVLVQYGNDMVNTIAYDEVHRRPVYRQLGNDYSYPLQQISYDYDGVGNIIHLSQNAPPYYGYGGEYQVSYTYDEQYRLLEAWQNNSALGDYSYTMHYSPSGLVGTKVCPELEADIVFGYDYDGEIPFSHQPKMIHSPSYYEGMTLLSWDANGELKSVVQPLQDRFRRHWWNEAGQLSAVIGNEYCGYYGYNAQGERAYKLTGTVTTDQFNAGEVGINTYFDDIVLYVNPYMVVTPRGYTKHYYNGSQRIAARLGDYWAASVADESGMVAYAREVLEQTMNSGDVEEEYFEERYVRSTDGEEFYLEPFTLYTHYMTCSYSEDMLYEALNGGARLADHIGGIDRGIFYYHPDHLGSATWITDDKGQAVQYIHYMPYGELWENQQSNSYDERFKFTGKERDAETGYDYFGARYYSSMLNYWTSPDKKSDKYPHISSYAYCNWNPIKYVDPDGNEFINKLASPMQIRKSTSLSETQKLDMIQTNTNLNTNLMQRNAIGIDNVFELFAHGSPKSVMNKLTRITDANQLNSVLCASSPYLNSDNNNSSVFIFYACNTGAGENSIAQQFSSVKEVAGSVVIAPTGAVSLDNNGMEYVKNGGEWRVFVDGVQIDVISGKKGMMTKYVKENMSNIDSFLKNCRQKILDGN